MIYLTKTGIFYENHFNKKCEEYVYEEVDSIIPHLTEAIEIQDGFTLEEFFEIVENDKELIEIVFGSHLGHHPIQPYLDDIQKDYLLDDDKKDANNIDYIECYWETDQFDYKLFYEEHKNDEKQGWLEQLGGLHEPDKDEKNDITIGVGVHGWGKYKPEEDEIPFPNTTHIGYAIEFTPLYKLKHLPIKLNKKFIMKDSNKMGEDDKNVVEGEMDFSVFEVFGEILSEISFCGLPENRDDEWEDIKDDVDEMKENYKKEEENE